MKNERFVFLEGLSLLVCSTINYLVVQFHFVLNVIPDFTQFCYVCLTVCNFWVAFHLRPEHQQTCGVKSGNVINAFES